MVYHNIQVTISSAIRFIAMIFFPPLCAVCRVHVHDYVVLCSSCNAAVVPIVSARLSIGKRYQVMVHAVSAYTGPMRTLVVAKHTGDATASRLLAQLMVERLPFAHIAVDYIVPIPTHWTRRLRRGFNQSDEMAFEVSRAIKKPVARILYRTRATQFQHTLSKQERINNVHSVFALRYRVALARYANKHLVLIDDLMTTGATLTQAIIVLRRLRPASITVVVAARGI